MSAGAAKPAPWTEDEDEALTKAVKVHGCKAWSAISCALPRRTSKSCRERWFGHLSPVLATVQWSHEEDAILVAEKKMHGDRWDRIVRPLHGRTEAAAKKRWESVLKEKADKFTAPVSSSKRSRRGSASARGRKDTFQGFVSTPRAKKATRARDGQVFSAGRRSMSARRAEQAKARQQHKMNPPARQGSPPAMCQLPTGNVIGDGTFCPDDELFLSSRPPVSALLRTIALDAGFDAKSTAVAGSGRSGAGCFSDFASGSARTQQRFDISPLSTILTGDALESARAACDGKTMQQAGANSTEQDQVKIHLNRLLAKMKLGEIPPSVLELEGEGGFPSVGGVGWREPQVVLDPGLGHRNVESRGYFHRQILHKLFVSDSAAAIDTNSLATSS